VIDTYATLKEKFLIHFIDKGIALSDTNLKAVIVYGEKAKYSGV